MLYLLFTWVGEAIDPINRSPKVILIFWAAGKSLGPWATGLSISASFMSVSWSCVYAVQYTNKKARPKTGSVFLTNSAALLFHGPVKSKERSVKPGVVDYIGFIFCEEFKIIAAINS